MKMPFRIVPVMLCAAVAAMAGPVRADAPLPFQVPGSTQLRVPVKSFAELRFKQVVRQAYDLSCGAAALGTILNYFYDEPMTEKAIIEEMMNLGDKEKIVKEGFSLLEMKRYAEQKGYVANGYRITDVHKLVNLKIPAITLVNVQGYAHFVVIKGVDKGEVYLGDPAFGNRARPMEAFAKEWNGVILLVMSAQYAGNRAFTLDPILRADASVLMPILERALGSISPGSGEF